MEMDPTLLNRSQESDLRWQHQRAEQEERRVFLIQCDVFATIVCVASFLALLTFGAFSLYSYYQGMQRDSMLYSLIFVLLLVVSAICKVYTKIQMKEFLQTDREELELREVEQSFNCQIQQQAQGSNSYAVLGCSASRNCQNSATSACYNRTLCNRSSLKSEVLMSDVPRCEASDTETASSEYPVVRDHGEFIEYIFGPLPMKRPVQLKDQPD